MEQEFKATTLLLNKRDCARLLSVSLRTIDTLISTKELKANRIGRRVLVHRDTLTAFAKRSSTRTGGARG